MQISWKIAAMCAVLMGAPCAGLGVAQAQDATFDVGSVSVGYADGYMDQNHQFHVWEHRADAEQFRAKRADAYRAWRHDDPRHRGDEGAN